ncbi:MAG: hypothetical protein JXA46_05480 [Dehalococcoidales bacterium]|nr:hypothetical protein [Dehalococcoidales bacterium]
MNNTDVKSRSFSTRLVSILLIVTLLVVSVCTSVFPVTANDGDRDDDNAVVLIPPDIAVLPDSTGNASQGKSDKEDLIFIGKTEKEINADEYGEIRSASGKILLNVPEGSIASETNFSIDEYIPQMSTGMRLINYIDLNAVEVNSKSDVHQFNKPLNISITHTEDDLAGVDLDSLNLYYLDEKTLSWIPVKSTFNRETLTLSAEISHFSSYGELANPLQNGPGRVMAHQVSLYSGSATYKYTINLPQGPGGFTPLLELNYNSSSVDETKNRRAVASWVGTGWSMSLGSITLDTATKVHYLDLNGASYRLITENGVNYYTNPDVHFKITRNTAGNYWEVWDVDGNYYRFGGTAGSRQYLSNAIYYQWDLNLFRDTKSNQAEITYTQDIIGTGIQSWVRTAYPEYLKYDYVNSNYQIIVSFITGGQIDRGADGWLRPDNPISYGTNPAPKIMDTCQLDSIEIEIGGDLIRTYDFSYTTTNATLDASEYGGIYYAGRHTLSSIVETGVDGEDTLASENLTFSYELRDVYRSSSSYAYFGNPGNPTELEWPYLTSINNGYTGEDDTVTFTYTQAPSGTPSDIWTRQVVTEKSVNDGMGSSQNVTYQYTGNPQYLGTGWDQKFRGFTQVRETDVEENYVVHYFYTTGTVDSERLSGREYQTDWYEHGETDVLVKRVEYDWAAEVTAEQDWGYNLVTTFSLENPTAMAVSPDGYLYIISDNDNDAYDCVRKYKANGTYVTQFGAGTLTDPGDIAISNDGYIFVTDPIDDDVVKYNSDGSYNTTFALPISRPTGIAVSPTGNFYVSSPYYTRIYEFNSSGTYTGNNFYVPPLSVTYDQLSIPGNAADSKMYATFNNNSFAWIDVTSGSGSGWTLTVVNDIDVSDEGIVFVASEHQPYGKGFRIYDNSFSLLYSFDLSPVPYDGIAVGDHYFYITCTVGDIAGIFEQKFCNWEILLEGVQETTYGTSGNKIVSTEYVYDSYGNIVTEKRHGDTSTNDDDSTIWRTYNYNTSANILNKTSRERTYSSIKASDDGGTGLASQTLFYYDSNNNSIATPPTIGNVTRIEQSVNATASVSTYFTWDTYGNQLSVTDPEGNSTNTTYETTFHIYPATKTLPLTGLSENYTYQPGTGNLLAITDINDNTTYYEYDPLGRVLKIIKPGDTSESPSIEYEYNNWGTVNQQHIATITKIDGSNSAWQKEYFDGLGRVRQVHTQGEDGYTTISGTTAYDSRGLVEREYLPFSYNGTPTSYQSPDAGVKYTSYGYDGLGRVLTQTAPDEMEVSHDFSVAWREVITDASGNTTRYYYDAFQRLKTVEEMSNPSTVYATTEYTYDVLGNLIEVEDDHGNITSMTYDRLSRKTGMTDPDMGTWFYGYDDNGNLTTQTDAKDQTITMVYDGMNRLTNKNYPAGSGMTDVVYIFDQGTNGNGQRTGMTDASGNTTYEYDALGRLVTETRVIDCVSYETSYTYDGLDRIATITYPTGEVVTNGYNDRGLPCSLNGTATGNLVTSTLYNTLGLMTDINLGNGLKTTYGYYGTGGSYDTTGGYYGRLWEIKTLPQAGGAALQDVQYAWDANGNLDVRTDVLTSTVEDFSYDFLDRLTGVSDNYTANYTYDEIGNITSMNGVNYTYDSTQPHAVDAVGLLGYVYDDNGNMTTRGTVSGNQTLTWDAENRPISVSYNGTSASFVYDGDGKRVKKVEDGVTTLYLNQYFEVNITTTIETSNYYLGGKLIAISENDTVQYLHQDHLGSTSLMTDTSGNVTSGITYEPYGDTASGDVATDRKYTGQRLDETGLYFYNARYYDAAVGRFISSDSMIGNACNPQNYNRYSYCLNNPLKNIDPSGHIVQIHGLDVRIVDSLASCFFLPAELATLISDVVSSPEYRAYQAFRDMGPEAKHMAWTMEESTEHIVTINAETSRYWAESNKEGDNYTISINPDSEHEGAAAQARAIYWEVDSTVLDRHPDFDYGSAVWDQTVGELVSLNGKVDAVVAFVQYLYDVRTSNPAMAFMDFFFSSFPLSAFFSNLLNQQENHDLGYFIENEPYPFK